jgi:hypothetical protein
MIRRFLRAVLIYARSMPYDRVVQVIDWTDADAITAQRFFSQGTGKRLLMRLEMGVINMALTSAQKGDPHSCGMANGASIQLASLLSHFPLGQAQQPESEESEQEAALDHFAPDTA